MSWLFIPTETLPEPQTCSLACRSALEREGLTSASPLHAAGIELCVTSSGKVTLRPPSWRGWKTRPWIKHLSGTTLQVSMAARGVERWISSLAAIHVNLSASRASARGRRIPAIYGHTLRGSSGSANPNGCFWKTSPITSTSAIARSEASWKNWATGLRNPLFVEALMGWPTGWTGFDFAATAWFPWLQRMRSEFLRLGLMMDDKH